MLPGMYAMTITCCLKKTKVGRKLLLIIGSALVGIILLISMALMFLKHDLLREREHMTRHLVQSAHSIVAFYHGLALQGKITQEEARSTARDALKSMRYDDQDMEYFWINDMHPRVIMHPIKPELEGKDVSGFRDPNGNRLFVQFVETVRKQNSGFVYYLWTKPGFEKPVLKVSYVMGFEPWGWVIGSGMYLDDVNAAFWSSTRNYALAGFFMFSLVLAMSLLVARSITRNEEALRISEEKFSKAFHVSPDGVAITRWDGYFIDVNDALLQMLGYAREEIIGHSSLDLNIWLDRSARARIVEQSKNNGPVRNREISMRSKSGTALTLLWSSDVIVVNGEQCLMAVLKDITAEKENKRQLLKSKAEITVKHEQLSSLFKDVELVKKEWERTMDCIQDMVILLDRNGNIRRCNRAAVEFSGNRFEDLIGLHWVKALRFPGMSSMEIGHYCMEIRDEASGRWFLFTCYPYTEHDDASISGAVITIHDTTESKLASISEQKANEELKETQAQMLQQEKMASIGQLAAGVAHEINNPTGFIMSNLGSLGKYTERLIALIQELTEAIAAFCPAETQKKLAETRKRLKIDHILSDVPSLIAESIEGAERVKKIVQDLKCFSRVDDAQFKPTSLAECLDSTINIVWNELKYKASLAKDYGDLPLVGCYPQQLNQVFMNLLVNAAHAIEKEGEIGIRTWCDRDNAFVSISDTGCGIPEEIRPMIFDPFFTTKDVGTGTGLGLSISYDIVKRHGGDISVTSIVGSGTTFTIRLPLNVTQALDTQRHGAWEAPVIVADGDAG